MYTVDEGDERYGMAEWRTSGSRIFSLDHSAAIVFTFSRRNSTYSRSVQIYYSYLYPIQRWTLEYLPFYMHVPSSQTVYYPLPFTISRSPCPVSFRLRTTWLWVRIPLLSLKLQISRLFRTRSSLRFRQLWSVDSLWNAYVTFQ